MKSQYKNSDNKAEILKEIIEIIRHRKHIDGSIELIGSILYGPTKASSTLTSVRAPGLPLVDDWQCLKSTVTCCFSLCYLVIFSCIIDFRFGCRFGHLKRIVGHWLNMAWNTCEHLQIFATAEFLRHRWRKLVLLPVGVMSWVNGTPWTKIIVLESNQYIIDVTT